MSAQFRVQSSRTQSARVLSGLNRVETPIGRHLSDRSTSIRLPNLFDFLSLLDGVRVNDVLLCDKCPRGVPADDYMGFIAPALCTQRTIIGFRIAHKAVGVLLRDLEPSFRGLLPWQRNLSQKLHSIGEIFILAGNLAAYM